MRVAGGADPPGRRRQDRGGQVGQLAQRSSARGSSPTRPSPRGPGWAASSSRSYAGSSYGWVARSAREHRRPAGPRQHHLEPGLGDPLDLADLAHRRRGPRAAGGRCRCRWSSRRSGRSRRSPPAPAAASASSSGSASPTGTKTTSLSSVLGPRLQRTQRRAGRTARPARRRPRGRRRRRWCARRTGRSPPCTRRCTTRPFGVVAATEVVPAQAERVVGEQQVVAARDRLVDDGLDRVDGQQHAAHRRGRVAADQADRVPRLGPRRRVEAVEHLDEIGQRRESRLEARAPPPAAPATG